MNLRPSGYEPDELPDCSTPRYKIIIVIIAFDHLIILLNLIYVNHLILYKYFLSFSSNPIIITSITNQFHQKLTIPIAIFTIYFLSYGDILSDIYKIFYLIILNNFSTVFCLFIKFLYVSQIKYVDSYSIRNFSLFTA